MYLFESLFAVHWGSLPPRLLVFSVITSQINYLHSNPCPEETKTDWVGSNNIRNTVIRHGALTMCRLGGASFLGTLTQSLEAGPVILFFFFSIYFY